MTEITAKMIRDFVIERRDHVSFVELCDNIPGFRAADDEKAFEIGVETRNIVFWGGLSRAAADALFAAIKAGYVHYQATQILTYLVDGCVPKMPVVKQGRKYKHPHWLPVVLKLGPDPDPSLKKRKKAV